MLTAIAARVCSTLRTVVQHLFADRQRGARAALVAASVVFVGGGSAQGQVVISQIYGAGGNAGALWNADYVELYNRGSSTVSVASWSVQYNSSTGTGTWSVVSIPAGKTIAPGQYFLLSVGTVGGTGSALPTPDVTSTSIAASATDGKFALCNNTTALTGAAPTSSAIQDYIGYGGANTFEGGGAAPAAGTTFTPFRAGGGAIDTGWNAADFAIGTPRPRNTATYAAQARTPRDCRVELNANAATANGALGTDEYSTGNSSRAFGSGQWFSTSGFGLTTGGGTGFGGQVGTGDVFMHSDGTNLYVAFRPGANMGSDIVVIYLDTKPGGFDDSSMNDTADTLRAAITNLGSFGNEVFPPGFGADYAITVDQNSIAAFELNGGSLNFIGNNTSVTGANTTVREIAIPLSSLGGLQMGANVDFFAAYCSNTNFLSNESIPVCTSINYGSNPNNTAIGTYNSFARVNLFSANATEIIDNTNTTAITLASVDGSISTDEYATGNIQKWTGGGNGFGSILGGGTIYMDSDGAGLKIGIQPGAALGTGTDCIVMFLDTRNGGFNDATQPSDSSTIERSAASDLGIFGNDSFPYGMYADYAIVTSSNGIFLFELTGTGTLTPVTGTASVTAGTAASPSVAGTYNNANPREIYIPFNMIGNPAAGSNIQFFTALVNGSNGFLSNESIPASGGLNGGTNPGSSATGTYTGFGRFRPYASNCTPKVLLFDYGQVLGGAVRMQEYVSSVGNIQYQWRKGATPVNVAGATDPFLALSATVAADYAPYSMLITTPCGGPFTTSLTAQYTLSQIGNNTCGTYTPNAAAVTIPSTGGNITGHTGFHTNDGATSCGTGGGRDCYYLFTPSSAGPWTIQTCSPAGYPSNVTPTLLDTIVSIHTACPATSANTVAGGCDDDGCSGSGVPSKIGGTTGITLTAGTPYVIRVAQWSTTGATGPFVLQAFLTPPANDTCASATSLTVTSGSATVTASNALATDDGITPSCGTTSKDVWYSFTTGAAQAGLWRINTCGSAIDTVLSVYTTCGGAELASGCNDDATTGPCSSTTQSEVNVTLLASTTYRVRVASKGAGAAGGSFTLNVDFASPPANDTCATATTATMVTTAPFITTVAGNNTFAASALDATQPSMCATAGKDVFYTVTIPALGTGLPTTNSWDFKTCTGTTQDTVLQVLDACGGNVLGCNDDFGGCGSGTQSSVSLVLAQGTTVKVRVASKGVSPAGGAFTLTIAPTPPSNDNCAGAIALSSGVTLTTNNLGATTDALVPTCQSNTKYDMWYSYTPCTSGTVYLNTCGSKALNGGTGISDTVLQVYTGTCGSPVAFTCFDDYTTAPANCVAGNTLEAAGSFTGVAGTTYLIRFSPYGSATVQMNSFKILVVGPTDNVNPTIVTCASGQSAFADGSCQAVVPDFTGGVSATDNCTPSGSLVITQSPAAGAVVGLGTTVVTITVKDAANNQATCNANFVVSDNTPPSITCGSSQSASADGSCQAAVPDFTAATSASDNCGPITKTQVPAAGTLVGLGTTVVTVRATDGAGNFAECNTSFIVSDTTPPSVTCGANQMGNADANCQAAVPDFTASASASDNCGPITLSQSPAAGTLVGFGPHSVTVTATDGAGNFASCVNIFTVVDVTPPTITCGSDQSAFADANCQAPVPDFAATATAADNCTFTVSQSPLAGTLVGLGAHTVTVTVTDQGGNTATCNNTFTVTDNTPPSLTCGANQSAFADASCAALIPDFTATASATDNCTAPGLIVLSQTPAAGGSVGLGVHSITVKATDGAGNFSTCVNTFTVTDNTPPSVTCGANQSAFANASCSATVPDFTATASASDNCDTSVTLTQSPAAGTPVGVGVHNVTVTATDDAGNFSTCVNTFTVTDNTPPAVTCPGNTTVAAGASCTYALADFTGAATASDNCGAVTVTQSPAAGAPLGLGTHSITLTATDGAGLTATCSFDVTVTDQTPPSITCPSNTTVAAGASCTYTLADFTGAATASDNCPGVVVTQSPAAGAPLGLGVHSITLTATDGAGLTATCSFDVEVTDQTPPSITCPSNTTVAAGASCTYTLADFTGAATASDNCPGVVVTQSPAAGGSLGLGVHSITLTATDGAGNTASCSFDVEVTDQTPPSITCPSNTTVAAGASCTYTLADFTGAATASDNCGPVTVTQSPAAGGSLGLGTHSITLTATDGAGLTATCSFDVEVTDQTPPSITCHSNTTVAADATCHYTLADFTGAATASDNCGPVTVTQSPAAGGSLGLGTHSITLTAMDGAGLTSSCSFDVTVTDQTPPSITCPATTIVAADASCSYTLADFTGSATASDNCGAVTVTQSPAAGGSLGLGVHSITLTATDGAGNTASCSFDVEVTDQTPPSITCPSNTTVAAGASCTYTLADFTGAAAASDNCGPVTVTQSPAAGGSLGLGMHSITLTATDGAGNTASCSFDLEVTDQTPPSVTCGSDQSAFADGACLALVPDFTATATASDNCGAVTLSQSPAAGSPVGLGAYTITVTATDGAGNTATCTNTFTVTDNTPPSVSCGIDQSAFVDGTCHALVPDFTATATASDNCGPVTLSQSPPAGTAVGVGVHTVTVTATDGAGNTATCDNTFTVTDNTPPSITHCASAITENLSGRSGARVNPCQRPIADFTGDVTATDNCGAFTVTQSPAAGTLVGLGTTSVTITVTDQYGNETTCTTSYTLIDDVPPSITCGTDQAAFADANCQAGVPDFTLSAVANDACGAVTLSQTPAAGVLVGLGMTTVTVTATDGSGNTASCTNTFTVTDNTPPSVTCGAPQSAFADGSCSALVPDFTATATYSDNCTAHGSLVVSQSPAAGSSVGLGSHIVTVTVTDGAGNFNHCDATFTVTDNTPPSIVTCASPQSIPAVANCEALVPDFTGGVVAHDNCTPDSSLSITQTPVAGATVGTGTHTITIHVADATGNTADCNTTLTVQDDPPYFSGCPSNITVTADPGQCNAAASWTPPEGHDGCDPSPVVTSDHNPGDVFPVGVTTVTYLVTDNSNQTATCVFTVTVLSGGPPSTVYVDDSWTGTALGADPDGAGPAQVFGCDSFATIQGGVDGVASCGDVIVYAGLYAENVHVGQCVNITGPFAGVCANSAALSRGAEAVVVPATNDPLEGIVFYVTASNVTIDGLTIDADNTAIGGGIAINGADSNAANCVSNGSFEFPTAMPFVNVDHVSVVNNIILNANDVAVNFYEDGLAAYNGNNIDCNRFDNSSGVNPIYGYTRIGALVYNDWYGSIDLNYMTRTAIGVQTGNNHIAGDASSITSNYISTEVLGIWHNLHYQNAADWTIEGNTVEGAPSFEHSADGIYVSSIQTAVSATVHNNHTENLLDGVLAWNNPTTRPVTVSVLNSVNCDYGVRLRNVDVVYGPGAPTTLLVSSCNISGGIDGLWVDDDATGTDTVHMLAQEMHVSACSGAGGLVTGSRAQLSVRTSLTTFTSSPYGLDISGGFAMIETTNLTGNTSAGLRVRDGATVDAGDCAGNNYSGLGTGSGPAGSSAGGNLLGGYGYDNASPHAVDNQNADVQPYVLAQFNDWGANVGDDIENVIHDDTDSPAFSQVIFSQNPIKLKCPPAVNVQCVSNIPAGATTLADFTTQGGVVSASSASVSFVDVPPSLSGDGNIIRTYTVTDDCGQSTTCDQLITVDDTIPPTITHCASSASAFADATCSAPVPDFSGDVTAIDNCSNSVITVTQSPAAGTLVGRGLHGVTITVSDGHGNIRTCLTSFTVIDNTPPSITCPVGFTVAADAGCQYELDNYTGLATASDNCGTALVSQSPLPGSLVGPGVHTITLTANDGNGNTASCTFDITVTDQTPPSVTCGAPQAAFADASCSALVPDFIGTSTISDNCTPFGSLTISQSPAAGASVGVGVHTVTITVTDGAGNSNNCNTTFTVTDNTPPTVACGAPQSAFADATCSALVPDFIGTSTIADNCTPFGSLTIVQSPAAGTAVGLGVHAVTITVTDGAGNSSGCGTSFTVTDNTPPSITCGAPQSAFADATCHAEVPDFTAGATATDNCGPIVKTQTPAAGTLAGLGANTITVTATDGAGNSASCNATFTVIDNTPPVIDNCAPPQSISAAPNCQGTVPDFTGGVVAHDNCTPSSSLSVTQSPLAGASLPVGVHTITLTVTDATGNQATCVASLTITDNTPPSISSCSPPQSANADANCSAVIPDFTSGVVASDACSAVTVVQSPAAGTAVGLGSHNILLTVSDSAGNTSTCTTTFTVNDITPPSVPYVANVTVYCGDLRDPPATGVPTSTDACGPVTLTFDDNRSGLSGCNATGVIVRTWTATDGSGNASAYDQTITVVDNTPPVLGACPANISVDSGPSACNAVVSFTLPTAYDQCYDQGFENPQFTSGDYFNAPSTDWNDSNSMLNRVLSGFAGVPSHSGSAHAVIDSTSLPASPDDYTGAFTRLGGYSSVFGSGFKTSVAVYIDLNDPAVLANTYGWDLSSAASDQSGSHRRDFVFHAASNNLGQVLIGGSNNSNFTRRNDLASINHYTIIASGWYIFESDFRDNAGVLAVDLNLRDSGGALLWTETRSDPSDLISTIVGGNRYMWFTFLETASLAIDDTQLRRNTSVTSTPSSGSSFPIGTTPVVVTTTDACGNPSTCTFNVTVTDTTPPTIACGPGQSAFADANCHAPVPDFTLTASASDNCGYTLSQSPAAGALVGVGVTTVTVTATDGAGNSASCNTTFTVTDNTPPSLVCPPPIVEGTSTASRSTVGCTALIPDFTFHLNAHDNCTPDGSLIVTQNPPAGTEVGLGTHAVTITVTDAYGNTVSCTTSYTLTDDTAPTISCPPSVPDLIVNANCQVALPSYTSLGLAKDNCTGTSRIIITQSPAAGTVVTVGDTLITLTADDQHGNTASCSFTVHVKDTTPPSISVCPSNQNVSVGANCTALLPDLRPELTAHDNCTSDANLTVTQSPAPGTPMALHAVVHVTFTVTDQSGNIATCSCDVTAVDTTQPSLTCGAPQSASADATCMAAVPNFIATSTYSDNCTTNANLTVSQSPAAGAMVGLGAHTVTVTVTDESGNSINCNTTFTVSDTTAPSITCGAGQSAFADGSCSALVPDFISTSTYADNCTAHGSIIVSQSPAAGSSVGLGVHTVTVTVTDGAGNSNHCDTTFTVTDNTPPSITCGAGQSAFADASCSALVPDFMTTSTYADDCTAHGDLTVTQSPAAGTPVGLGVHTVTVTVTDASGNSNHCDTTFTVTDNTPPSITCGAPQSAFGDATCSALVPDFIATSTYADNCTAHGALVVSQSPAAGTAVTTGVHTITITVTDASGNSNHCDTTFTVTDNTPPSITCGAGQSAFADASCSALVPDFVSTSTYGDNCTPTGSLIVTQSPAAGSTVSIGVHTVTVTVTDASGNSNHCDTTFTVTDNTPPSITCGAGQSAFADGSCSALVPDFISTSTYADNCTALGALIVSQSPAAGTPVSLGVHTVTVTVTDASGNSNHCDTTFTVTDNTPPSITCGAGQSAFADGSCSALVPDFVSTSTYADNCTAHGTLIVSQSPAAGTPVSLGVHTVTVTVTDASGNSNHCDTTFTVTDNTPPSITCGAPQSAFADGSCSALVPDFISTSTYADNCTALGALSVSQSPAAGTPVSLGVHTVTVTVTDASGNSNHCDTTFTVTDNTPPSITCGAGQSAFADGSCSDLVPDFISTSTYADNCTPSEMLTVVQSPAAGTPVSLGAHTVTVTVTDASGNSNHCDTTFTVTDNTPPSITCGAPQSAPANGACQAAVPDFISTASYADNCTAHGSILVSQSPAAGTLVTTGTHTVTVTVTDASGNSNHCDTTFIVNDNTPPSITCGAGQSAFADASCSALVPDFISTSTYADNCTAHGALIVSQSPAAGATVTTGIHTITVTVTDGAGNSNSCNTTFTVTDNTQPSIVCGAPQSAFADGTCQAAVPDFIATATYSDNCTPTGGLTVVQSPAAGTLVGLGVTTVTVTVTDASGNSNHCDTTFTVNDNTPPVINSCSGLAAFQTGVGCVYVLGDFRPDVNAVDNCSPVANLTITQSPAPGTPLGVGNYTITFTVTDQAGNFSICTRNISVTDPYNIIYVNWAAVGANDGTSWANAFTTLQAALAATCDADEIWVAKGTYRPDAFGGPRSSTFYIPAQVRVYGGFNATESLRNQRNVVANVTTLSGDLDSDDNLASFNDNSYHVVTFGTGLGAVLDGFTILGGNANGVAIGDQRGGGVLAQAGNPILAKCRVIQNFAQNSGGGIYADASGLRAVNTLFLLNASPLNGGAVAASGGTPSFMNCIFNNNLSYGGDGAAFHGTGSAVTVINSTFYNNQSAASVTGGIRIVGGSMNVVNTILWNNVDSTGVTMAAQLSASGGTISATYSLIKNLGAPLLGFGNISSAPLFRDDNGPDNVVGTLDDDFRLFPISPGVDAGNNSAVPSDFADLDQDSITAEVTPYDYKNFTRFLDVPFTVDSGLGTAPIVDMGAHENTPCVSDLNNDGIVGTNDLVILLGQFGQFVPPGTGGDINGDGFVNTIDLTILLGDFGCHP